MKRVIVMILCFFLIPVTSLFTSEEGQIYLQSIRIEGNRVTKERYIRNLITLDEDRSYEFDEIIDQINRSRENLELTGLFSNVFFNDELDDQNNLVLTVQLKERNYFFFGPSGYLGYEGGEFYSVVSLYADYTNLFGNASRLFVEVPFYRDYGIIARFKGGSDSVQYMVGIDARYDNYFDENVQKFVVGLGYGFSERFLLGTNIHVSRESPRTLEDHTLSTVFLPYLRFGYAQRLSVKQKSWYSLYLAPYLGINHDSVDGSEFYGIDSRLSLNWDVFLKIVFSLNVYASYQDGDVPNDYIIQSNIRGTYYDVYRGSYLFSVTSEFDFPWPWNNSIHLVPFLDYGMIGDSEVTFLLGGGLGLHWYTKYQNPLVLELAYGKGVMLNLTKRF